MCFLPFSFSLHLTNPLTFLFFFTFSFLLIFIFYYFFSRFPTNFAKIPCLRSIPPPSVSLSSSLDVAETNDTKF
jgi:hypothetical protein